MNNVKEKILKIVIPVSIVVILVALVLLLIGINKKNKNIILESAKTYIGILEVETHKTDAFLHDGSFKVKDLTLKGIELQRKQKDDGSIEIDNFKVTWAELIFNNYIVTYNSGTYNISKDHGYRINYKLENGKVLKCTPKGIGTIDAIYFNPTTGEKCDINEYHDNYNSYHYNFVGDVTEMKSGCLKWYPYSTDGDNINLILDHNIVASKVSFNEIEEKLSSSIELWKDYNARILTKNELETIIDNKINGELYLDSCSNEANELLEGNTESLAKYTKENISIYQWLFIYTNCKDFGCRESSYSNDGYWISDSYYINNEGKVKQDNGTHGIRPVITINKNLLEGE